MRADPAPGAVTGGSAVESTVDRIRQLVDGLESAVARGDRDALRQLATGPALRQILARLQAVEARGARWWPGREELTWRAGGRGGPPPLVPGRRWLRLRFTDRSQLEGADGTVAAAATVWEVQVEVVQDRSGAPWRLRRMRAAPAPRCGGVRGREPADGARGR